MPNFVSIKHIFEIFYLIITILDFILFSYFLCTRVSSLLLHTSDGIFRSASFPDLKIIFGLISQSVRTQIKQKVQECINKLNLEEEKVRRIVGNIRKRAELCIQENGGHFEHLL